MAPKTKKPTTASTVNGHAESGNNDNRFEHFYSKLSRLEDDVVSGKHPYYKLPEAALQQLVSSRPLPEKSDTTRRSPPPLSSSEARADTLKKQKSQKTDDFRNGEVSSSHSLPKSDHDKAALDSQAKASDANKKVPQIVPVLLTKSADLVKAELLLKRQKIERVLKDQLEQKRVQAQERDNSSEFASELDVTSLLNEALAIVKHVSGLRPRANSNSSVSILPDDNSYYSSRDNGSISEQQSVGKSKNKNPAKSSGVENNKDVDLMPEDYQPSVKESIEQPKVSNHDDATATQSQKLHFEQSSSSISLQRTNNAHNPSTQTHEAREESEYSPPAPEQFDGFPTINDSIHKRKHSRNFSNLTHRSTGKQLIREGNAALPIQTAQSPVVPVIRNHIEHPLAPQPARVSPLAVTKMPRIAQDKQTQLNQGHSEHYTASQVPPNTLPANAEMRAGPSQASADYSAHPMQHGETVVRPESRNSQKRARDADDADIQQISAVKKRVAKSPIYSVEPIVKEEPLSPVPLTASRPVRRRLVRAYPDDIEYLPRRESVNHPAYYIDSSYSRPVYRYEYDAPMSSDYVRAEPRVIYHRIERESPELRRTVSLQHVRRRASPVTYVQTYPQDQSSVSRVPSPYYMNRPPPQDECFAPRTYTQSRASKSPPPYVGIQGPREPVRAEMPPPPSRRVVSEQHIERYQEMPPPDWREPVGPPIRQTEIDPYHEAAIPPPTQEYRMQRRVQPLEIYENDSRLYQPARPISRRYHDMPLTEREYVEQYNPPQRAYSMRPVEDVRTWHDYVHYQQSSSRYAEPVERRVIPTARDDDMNPVAREYETRSYSVRPERTTHEVAAFGASPTSHMVSVVPPKAPLAPPLRSTQESYRQPSASVPPQAGSREHIRPAEVLPLSSTNNHYDEVESSGTGANMRAGARPRAGIEGIADEEYLPVRQQQYRQQEPPVTTLHPPPPMQARRYSYAASYHHQQVQGHRERYIGDDEPYDPASPVLATGPLHDKYKMTAPEGRRMNYPH